MESLRELYRIGHGPSASHTMGPRMAAERYRERYPNAASYKVIFYGSLAATGKGHLTDVAVKDVFAGADLEIEWRPGDVLAFHPNGMRWSSRSHDGEWGSEWEVYSVGGGALREVGETAPTRHVYELRTMDELMAWSRNANRSLWQYVRESEGEHILDYLAEVWAAMQAAIARGLSAEGILPGMLRVPRKAQAYYLRAMAMNAEVKRVGLVSAYALAVSEENASGATIVTAPTCGSSGVVPAVLHHLKSAMGCDDSLILKGLATAGLVGNLIKHNASISGAEVGCQGEVGTACAMAAAAATCILGGATAQIEYAAEMGIEHHLGLTCDPIGGLVQIPCIERNAVAAARALDCAAYALLSDGTHRISFDQVVETMRRTGLDMKAAYRETSNGGLALINSERGTRNAELETGNA